MRYFLALAFPLWAIGCSDDAAPSSGDISTVQDLGPPVADLGSDGAAPDAMGEGPDGGPPPPGSLAIVGGGSDFVDVSTDQGGNVWGATPDSVVFFQAGTGKSFRYGAADGLAHGRTTWADTYWFGTPGSPSTQPVTFTAVAGGLAGQAFVGNIGYTGDRFEVDPQSGAVRAIVALAVTSIQQPDPTELAEQQLREVATWRAVVDIEGTYHGAAYFGGFHGTSALYNMTVPRTTSVCGCYDYQEHIHPFLPNGDSLGGDVHALAITPQGDLWIGDRRAIYFLPQRSLGSMTDLFPDLDGNQTIVPGRPGDSYLVPFPSAPEADQWIYGIGVDSTGGLWVASYGNGLVHLSANTYDATFFTEQSGLPTSYLTGVAVDPTDEIWIATEWAGALRYTPRTGRFTRYTRADGLPSNHVRQVYVDRYRSNPRAVYFATDNGIAVYTGP